VAGFHGTPHNVVMSRLGIGNLGCGTYKYIRRARTLTTKQILGVVISILSLVGWGWQGPSIESGLELLVNEL